MRVTVVGCSGSFPGPTSSASCYLVESDGYRVVLDLGNGSLGALQRHIDLDDIDAVLLSHLHADHCLDLCSYYVYRRYHPGGARPRIPVFGPSGTASRMARAYDLPEDPGMSAEFEFIDLGEGEVPLGPLVITARRVNHPVEAYGFRLTDGERAIAYSGDTGRTPALLELASGVDVALLEASCLDADPLPDVHLTAREAGQYASDAGVGHLVLTHLVPWNDPAESLRQAREAFAGEVTLAESGLVLSLA